MHESFSILTLDVEGVNARPRLGRYGFKSLAGGWILLRVNMPVVMNAQRNKD